jgi:hypothetical protein
MKGFCCFGFSLLLLSGCTFNVVDKRLTREEVAGAFKERDEALKLITIVVKELQEAEIKRQGKK